MGGVIREGDNQSIDKLKKAVEEYKPRDEPLEKIIDETIQEVKNLKEDEEIYPPLENVVEEEITDEMRKEFEIASKLIKKRELEEVEKLTKKKECKVQNSCEAKENGLIQISKDIHQLSKDINLCNNAILKGNNTILDFRISSHKANVHVGKELKDIHKFQGKFVFLALLLNALVFTAFGIVLDSNKNDILPYVNSAINFAKTANSISSR